MAPQAPRVPQITATQLAQLKAGIAALASGGNLSASQKPAFSAMLGVVGAIVNTKGGARKLNDLARTSGSASGAPAQRTSPSIMTDKKFLNSVVRLQPQQLAAVERMIQAQLGESYIQEGPTWDAVKSAGSALGNLAGSVGRAVGSFVSDPQRVRAAAQRAGTVAGQVASLPGEIVKGYHSTKTSGSQMSFEEIKAYVAAMTPEQAEELQNYLRIYKSDQDNTVDAVEVDAADEPAAFSNKFPANKSGKRGPSGSFAGADGPDVSFSGSNRSSLPRPGAPRLAAASESVADTEQSLTEEANPQDTVTLNVPLFLRLMEYAKEDAKTDMDLHDVTEKVISLSEQGDTLTMDHYDEIVSGPSGGEDTADMTEAWDDDDYDDDFDSRRFARRGSALHAADDNNPRMFPCPTCGCPNRLTRRDQIRGYQCDRCADTMERGGEIHYCDDEQEFDESSDSQGASRESIVDAIMGRIHAGYLDQALEAIREHGIEAFNDAVESEAAFHEGATELGTSDVGGMVKSVFKRLGMQESTMESITECGMMAPGAPGEPQVNISVSKTTTDNSGAGSVSVSGNAKDTETLNQLLKLAGLDLTVSDQPAAPEVTPCGATVVDVDPAHAVSIAPEFDDGPDMGSASYSTNGTTLKDLLVNRMRDKFAQ